MLAAVRHWSARRIGQKQSKRSDIDRVTLTLALVVRLATSTSELALSATGQLRKSTLVQGVAESPVATPTSVARCSRAHPIRFQSQGPYRLQGSWLAPSNCLEFVDASFTPATIRSAPLSNDRPGMGPSTDHHGVIWGLTLGYSMLCSILLDMQQLSSLPLLLCLSAPAPPMDSSLQGMVNFLFWIYLNSLTCLGSSVLLEAAVS